jgi:hypothetical protein
VAKSEIGLAHFEGRSYQGLARHMILCQLVLPLLAEQMTQLEGEKSAGHDGADGPRVEHDLPLMAAIPVQTTMD